jgi:hypothetical protein
MDFLKYFPLPAAAAAKFAFALNVASMNKPRDRLLPVVVCWMVTCRHSRIRLLEDGFIL